MFCVNRPNLHIEQLFFLTDSDIYTTFYIPVYVLCSQFISISEEYDKTMY